MEAERARGRPGPVALLHVSLKNLSADPAASFIQSERFPNSTFSLVRGQFAAAILGVLQKSPGIKLRRTRNTYL